MDRIRLTKRLASASKKIVAESQADGIFPGDIGNEERKKNYRKVDEYHTFEQTVNHELPDMRHDWQDNPRDEVGMGIPKKATKTMIVNAATNATKLAYFLLGEKASDQLIEQQARDFMRLGSVRLEAAINRFAETTDLHDEEEEAPAEVEAAEEEVVEEEVITEEDIAPETVEAAEEECEGEECEEDFDFGETNAADEDEASFPDELDGIFNDEEDDEEEAVEAVKTAKKFNEKLVKASKKASATDVNELAALWGSDNGVF